ncbi:MAG: YicC family protein [Bacteroides sp.]|nr:YicC family protein [Bacteroides sp.]MCM1084960.1 YicC family protein [Bacteroides sp.]
MIKSMTGYGKCWKETDGRIFQVEARSINSKTLDLNMKLPAEYRALEPELRAKVAAVLSRGKVELAVSVTQGEAAKNLYHINPAQLDVYRRELESRGIDAGEHMGALLRLPGVVMDCLADEVSESEKTLLLALADECLKRLDESRMQEGAVMKKDLELRVSNIEELAGKTDAYEQERVPAIRARLEQHLAEWSKDGAADRNRLEQEMIYYLEKLDVTEEKVRLAKHCRYYRDTLEEEGAGRKLAFIAQEMGREINTLGSKANHAEMQKLVVRMKDELEKIKEQLFNIL